MADRTKLWTPSQERIGHSEMLAYQRWLADTRDVHTAEQDYPQLWNWSVTHLPEFWESIWEYFDVLGERGTGPVMSGDTMPGVAWFPGARINYAENMLRHAAARPDAEALVGVHEDARRDSLSWSTLSGRVGALTHWLRSVGVRQGDTVCAVLPNIPDAVVGLLASTAVGAVWSVVGADFAAPGVADRFAQIEPKVLLTVDGYRFNGKLLDRRAGVAELLELLPTVEHHVLVDQHPDELPWGEAAVPGTEVPSVRLSDVAREPRVPEFTRVEFSHPLWVLYSSGTTGKPKGIVQGHGGIVLEGLKSTALQTEGRAGDRAYSAVATTWMVWNSLVNNLLVGGTVITYDGSPAYEAADKQFQIVAAERVARFGTGAAILQMMEKSGLSPADRYDLSHLETIMSTGSTLPDSTWQWAEDHVGADIHIGSDSGGTDVCTAFIGSNPYDPIYLGELQGAWLGVAADSFDAQGRPVVDEVGELVITEPMPSMPVKFWNDPDGSKYRGAYFEQYPGVWRHGDWVTKLPGGQFIVHGRSDSTINRGGIRMGSADITQVVDRVPGVLTSMVIGAELEAGDYYMPLFVVPSPGTVVDDALRDEIVRAIRSEVSPRYVPDEIIEAPAVPTTRTGKLLEIPIKRILQGAPVESINRSSAADSAVLDWYVDFARSRRAQSAD
jgi:acetoacetyl-CoA synthetase